MKQGGFTFTPGLQLLTLVFISICLNVNTLFHHYALDDILVMTENKFVEKGILGIPEILTTDVVKGYSSKENILSQPRYRPVSLVIFALEHQFFGANPFVSHLINIILFALLVGLLFRVLQSFVFRKQHYYLAFITCLLFVVHPVHTEVIANVKSRDELIAFILLIGSLIALIRYAENKKPWLIMSGLSCFFLSLLTRESAITFIGVVPLILYFFYNYSVKKSIQFTIPLVIVFALYMLLRFLVVGFHNPIVTDVLNAPFLNATASQAFATKIFILFKYAGLLFFPYHLSSDYGYNQVPYVNLMSMEFLFSFIELIGLISFAVYAFRRRTLVSFAILYFIFTISLVSNLVVDVGTPLSERFLFQPSLAFCIVVASVYLKGTERSKTVSIALISIILVLFSVQTIARNSEWKSNETLFLADVRSSPNCARLNLYASEICIVKARKESNGKAKGELLDRAVEYGERSLEINSSYAESFLSLGFAYYYKHNYLKTADLWMEAIKLEPHDPDTKKCLERLSDEFYKEGNGLYEEGKIDESINRYKKSVELNNENTEAWYNLGGNYFLKKDTMNAMIAWEQVRKLSPNHTFKTGKFFSY